MFKILSTYSCLKKCIKCKIWRVAVRPSYIWNTRFLNFKHCTALINKSFVLLVVIVYLHFLNIRFNIYTRNYGCIFMPSEKASFYFTHNVFGKIRLELFEGFRNSSVAYVCIIEG